MSLSRHEPQAGETITVDLPDERTRATIEKVLSRTAVIAKIDTFTTGNPKSHTYKRGDLIACRFTEVGMNLSGWKVVGERELSEAGKPAEPKAEPEAEPAMREMVEGDL